MPDELEEPPGDGDQPDELLAAHLERLRSAAASSTAWGSVVLPPEPPPPPPPPSAAAVKWQRVAGSPIGDPTKTGVVAVVFWGLSYALPDDGVIGFLISLLTIVTVTWTLAMVIAPYRRDPNAPLELEPRQVEVSGAASMAYREIAAAPDALRELDVDQVVPRMVELVKQADVYLDVLIEAGRDAVEHPDAYPAHEHLITLAAEAAATVEAAQEFARERAAAVRLELPAPSSLADVREDLAEQAEDMRELGRRME